MIAHGFFGKCRSNWLYWTNTKPSRKRRTKIKWSLKT